MKKSPKHAIPFFFRLSHLYEPDYGFHEEEHFHRLADLERKRALRSNTAPALLLLDLTDFGNEAEADRTLRNVASVLFSSTREIDAKGWYRYPEVLGILVADSITTGGIPFSAGEAVLERLRANLAKSLTSSEIERIGFSYQTGLAPAGGLLAAQ